MVPVAEWIYFLHAPREDFAATMTEEEQHVWGEHFERLQRLLAEGVLVLAGPTMGRVNTGINVFEAEDEAAARRIMEEDPPSPAASPRASSGPSGWPCSGDATDGRSDLGLGQRTHELRV